MEIELPGRHDHGSQTDEDEWKLELPGRHLADFKEKLMKAVGYETIQLVTISRPSAYGEYEPYHFVETEQEFEQAVKNM